MGHEVDIEFASDGDSFVLLQNRRQNTYEDIGPVELPSHVSASDVIFDASHNMVPTTRIEGITHIVYVDPISYASIPGREGSEQCYKSITDTLRRVNDELAGTKFVMMGPGRWGTEKDKALGVPVGFNAISNCSLLVEIVDPSMGRYHEASFGTHFYGDLTRMKIHTLPIYPGRDGALFNQTFLEQSPNLVTALVPQAAEIEGIVRVIAIPEGQTLRFASDRRAGKALLWSESGEAQALVT
jgi:hypothetical protein